MLRGSLIQGGFFSVGHLRNDFFTFSQIDKVWFLCSLKPTELIKGVTEPKGLTCRDILGEINEVTTEGLG